MTTMKSYRFSQRDIDRIKWIKERLKYEDTDTEVIQLALWCLHMEIKEGRLNNLIKDEYLLDKSLDSD